MAKVLDTWTDLQTLLQSIAELGEHRVVKAFDPKHLVAKIKGVPAPIVGIVYEGLRSGQEPGSQTRTGVPVTLSFSVYLVVDSGMTIPGIETQPLFMSLLESMRLTVKGKISPTGHKWRLNTEAFGDMVEGRPVWVQRWETAMIDV
jgi:hypothetical protein